MCLTSKKNNRIFFKIVNIGNKDVKVWITPVDFTLFFIVNNNYYKNININSIQYSNLYNIFINNNFFLYILALKTMIKSNIFLVDSSISKDNYINYFFSDVLNGTRYNLLYKVKNNSNITSISSIYNSSVWVERELSEFNKINFIGIKDSRRLLTDYTIFNINNNNSFNTIISELYKRVLHWFFFFSFFFLTILISFIIYNKSLLQLILLSEVLLILLVLICVLISTLYNIYYLIGFSILLLIFGGLELSLNLLLITINC